MSTPIVPFHTFLWKVVSRCNINCSYCFVYNLGDDTWKEQPRFMSPTTARRTAERMREHLEQHGKKDFLLVFHGGEPMMLGARRMQTLIREVRKVFDGSEIKFSIGVQSNLLLFDEELGELMVREKMSVGVSLDGPPRLNDLQRVDFKGRGTGERLEQKLELLCSERFRSLFSGFLCVVNPKAAPEEVLDYLLSFSPRSLDFLLPLNTHENPPEGKGRGASDSTVYGDWLIRCYDRWVASGSHSRVRFFNSIIQLLCGQASSVESLGLLPVDLVVVETNGDIDAVDSLKAAFNGAARLGFSVFRHSFDEAARDRAVVARQLGVDGLCATCRRCELVDVCGGGYYPHRYSRAAGFDNPSVYCSEMSDRSRVSQLIKEEAHGADEEPKAARRSSGCHRDHCRRLRLCPATPARQDKLHAGRHHRVVLVDLRQTVRGEAAGHPGAHGGSQRAV